MVIEANGPRASSVKRNMCSKGFECYYSSGLCLQQDDERCVSFPAFAGTKLTNPLLVKMEKSRKLIRNKIKKIEEIRNTEVS